MSLKITVVIPTYNPNSYINRALASCFSQSETPSEIIVVDDGSESDVREVINEKYLKRIMILRQENAGPGAARNKGVKASNTEFIAFLDDDDEWLPRKLEIQAKSLGVKSMSVTDSHVICSDDSKYRHRLDVPMNEEEAIKKYALGKITSFTSGILVSKETFIDVEGFPEDLPRKEDHLFMMRYLKRYTLEYVTIPLFNRYKREEGLSANTSTENVRATFRSFLRELEREFQLRDTFLEQVRSHGRLREATLLYKQGKRVKSMRKILPEIKTNPRTSMMLALANLLPIPAKALMTAKRSILRGC